MKKQFLVASILFVALFAFLFTAAPTIEAAPLAFGAGSALTSFAPLPLDDLINAATLLVATLGFIPVFVGMLLQLATHYKLISHEFADLAVVYFNYILFGAAFAAILMGKTEYLSMLNHYLGQINPILAAFLALVAGAAHNIVKTRLYVTNLRDIQYSLRA